MTPWLTQAEIDDLCFPLTQAAAQCRFLEQTLCLTVKRKPNGAPLVLRSQFAADGELPMEHLAPPPKPRRAKVGPDRAGLVKLFANRSNIK